MFRCVRFTRVIHANIVVCYTMQAKELYISLSSDSDPDTIDQIILSDSSESTSEVCFLSVDILLFSNFILLSTVCRTKFYSSCGCNLVTSESWSRSRSTRQWWQVFTYKAALSTVWSLFYSSSVELYNGICNLPIFERSSKRLHARGIVERLLDCSLDMAKVATTRPVSIEDNVIFVIDTSKLPCPSDVRADDLGSWRCNGKQLCYCTLSPTGHVEEIQTRKPSNSKSTYGLIRRYYTHGTASDLRKTVAELIGKLMYISIRLLQCDLLYHLTVKARSFRHWWPLNILVSLDSLCVY